MKEGKEGGTAGSAESVGFDEDVGGWVSGLKGGRVGGKQGGEKRFFNESGTDTFSTATEIRHI